MRVGIFGGSGYTGAELLRILVRHPKIRVTGVTSSKWAGRPIHAALPFLRGITDLAFEPPDVNAIAKRTDFVFLALPHGSSMGPTRTLLALGKKVVDLSADFRLHDPETYRAWYKTAPAAPSLLKEAVYGLPESHHSAIAKAQLVANPGCYPTSALLALLPLLKDPSLRTERIIIDAKSGVSGAGRSPGDRTHFPEANESLQAYALSGHRHLPEINQESTERAGKKISVMFIPHLIPMNRGILSTVYLDFKVKTSADAILRTTRKFYAGAPFVRVLDEGASPNVSAVRGSNFCDLGVFVDATGRRAVILSAIDNLVKGASGQAVQNMNLMSGFEETAGLDFLGLFP